MEEPAGREDLGPLMREISAARDVLEKIEGLAYTWAAETLAGVADRLEEISRRLERSRPAEWMNHEECAAYLRTTPGALYKLPVPHHKLGGKRLYSRAEVDSAVRGL